MRGRPESNEAAPYYSTYINRVSGTDPVSTAETQMEEVLRLFATITKDKSLHRYAPDKWSIRQVLSHINDTERAFVFRALWFARGFDTPLPSFDQNISVRGADADARSWDSHVREFQAVRVATQMFFRNLPADAWSRRG